MAGWRDGGLQFAAAHGGVACSIAQWGGDRRSVTTGSSKPSWEIIYNSSEKRNSASTQHTVTEAAEKSSESPTEVSCSQRIILVHPEGEKGVWEMGFGPRQPGGL